MGPLDAREEREMLIEVRVGLGRALEVLLGVNLLVLLEDQVRS